MSKSRRSSIASAPCRLEWRPSRWLGAMLWSLALFLLCFAGLGISFYPHIVPPSLTIAQAAAPDASLAFLLAGAAPLLVLVLSYTAYAYWTFRGKVDPAESYH